jgi:hypothetical protein
MLECRGAAAHAAVSLAISPCPALTARLSGSTCEMSLGVTSFCTISYRFLVDGRVDTRQ